MSTPGSVTEVLPSLPANLCPQGNLAVWGSPPIYSSPSVVIGATPVTITVNNSVSCFLDLSRLPAVRFRTKTVVRIRPDPAGSRSTLTFPMTLTCTEPADGQCFPEHKRNSNSAPITPAVSQHLLDCGNPARLSSPRLQPFVQACTGHTSVRHAPRWSTMNAMGTKLGTPIPTPASPPPGQRCRAPRQERCAARNA